MNIRYLVELTPEERQSLRALVSKGRARRLGAICGLERPFESPIHAAKDLIQDAARGRKIESHEALPGLAEIGAVTERDLCL